MTSRKTLGLAVIAVVVASMVPVGAASASTATSPSGTTYTGTIKAESEGAITLHGVVDITCQKSTIEGKIEQHGSGVPAGGNVSSWTFQECGNNHTHTVKKGSFQIHLGFLASRWVTSVGLSFESTVTSLGITCGFSTNNTRIGTLTESQTTGGKATIDVGSAVIPRTSGSVFCGSSGELTGSYVVTTPSILNGDT